MAGSGKNNANKSRGKKKESVPARNPKKEAVGVCLIGLALILLYFSFAGGEIGIRQFLQGLAGYMLAGLALVVAWIGALLAFGGRDRRISPLRAPFCGGRALRAHRGEGISQFCVGVV